MKRSHLILAVLVVLSSVATGAAWYWQKNVSARRAADEEAKKEASLVRGRTPIFSAQNNHWQPAPEEAREAARRAILTQFEAFKRDDYFAATRPPIADWKKRFPSVAVFRAMIKRFYPQFASSKSVKFGAMRFDPETRRVAVKVILTAMDGTRSSAVYLLAIKDEKYIIESVVNIFVLPEKRRPANAAPSIKPPSRTAPARRSSPKTANA